VFGVRVSLLAARVVGSVGAFWFANAGEAAREAMQVPLNNHLLYERVMPLSLQCSACDHRAMFRKWQLISWIASYGVY
jgi:hypothetical protein